jgi:hypothetical protein
MKKKRSDDPRGVGGGALGFLQTGVRVQGSFGHLDAAEVVVQILRLMLATRYHAEEHGEEHTKRIFIALRLRK